MKFRIHQPDQSPAWSSNRIHHTCASREWLSDRFLNVLLFLTLLIPASCTSTHRVLACSPPEQRQIVFVSERGTTSQTDHKSAFEKLLARSGRTDGAGKVDDVVIRFPASSYQPASAAPVRIATLRTGEVIPLAWSLADSKERAQTVSTFGLYSDPVSQPLPAMRTALASIRQPFGTRDLASAFNTSKPPHASQSSDDEPDPIRITITRPLPANRRQVAVDISPPLQKGLAVISGHWPTATTDLETPDRTAKTADTEATLRFFIGDEPPLNVIELRGYGDQRRVLYPDGREVKLTARTDRLLVTIHADRMITISSDGHMLARVPRSSGQIVRMEVEGCLVRETPAAKDQSGNCLSLEPLLIRQVTPITHQPAFEPSTVLQTIRRIADQDRVLLNTGDELFGAVTAAGQTVDLRTTIEDSRLRQIDRSLVTAICLRRTDRLAAGSVDGVFSIVHLAPDASCSLAGIEEAFWMRAAIVAATPEGLRASHPLLGNIVIRWSMIRQINPLFAGTFQLIHPGPVHPGNAYREAFRRIEPDGTRLSFRFELTDTQRRHPVYLSADVAELIPSAPGTLKATPFLDEVRAGGLATHLFLNDEPVGVLNNLITTRSPVTSPERVRIQLPRPILRNGNNTIEFRQTPARDNPASYDDFEMQAIAIEVEHTEFK